MSKVFITDYISNPHIEKKILKNKLTNNIKDKNISILLVWHKDINKKYLDNFPNLKAILRYGVGYENIDLEQIKKRKLLFCNNPDYGADEVSDTCLSVALCFSRGIFQYNGIAKKMPLDWQENTINNIKRNSNTTVGIIGVGRIGSLLIKKLNYIGFNTIFYDPFKEEGYDKVIKSRRVENIEEIARFSDIVSVNCSLDSSNKGLINKKFISKMKRGSSLINSARGGLIENIDDFYVPIKLKKIDSIFLDVLSEEPPKKSKLIYSWINDKSLSTRIIINPHTSYYSKQSYTEMRKKISINALNLLNNKSPKNVILDARK